MRDEFKYDVFLSHSSKDKPVVRDLAERLKKDGLKVWFDEWVLKLGDSIPAKIEEGLEHSRVLVLCMSAHAFGSDWAQLESGTFRFRDPLNKQRRFVPLRLDDVPIKGSLRQFLCVSWFHSDRESDYVRLLEACRPSPTVPLAEAEAVFEMVGKVIVGATTLKTRFGAVTGWTFRDLPNRQTGAYHRELCEQYVDLDSFGLLELCNKWRLLAEQFTNDAYACGRHGTHVVHEPPVDSITRLIETACAARGMPELDRLSRCLRRPDCGHLHKALALLDDLEARLRAEAIIQETAPRSKPSQHKSEAR